MINKRSLNKKGQVTLFVIIAIILVAGIILFFLLRGGKIPEFLTAKMPEPQQYIEKCAKDSAIEAVNIMLPQGGYISPTNYKMYSNNKVGYLCYINNYYYPCINQEPMYIEHLEEEIRKYIQPKIEDCFYNLKENYQKKKYSVDMQEEDADIDVKLGPKKVEINIEKRFEASKEETKRFDRFKIKFNSPLYDLAVIAQEISNQEAKFCYFNYLGYSLLYPEVDVERKTLGSDWGISKIYIIKDKTTGKELLIAIRSCAMPGGL